MQDEQVRAPRANWPHCLRLLTGRTEHSLDVEARYVIEVDGGGTIDLRVRIAHTCAFGTRSWGCVDQRVGGEWERLLWVDIDEFAIASMDIEAPLPAWRGVISDDAHDLATKAAAMLVPTKVGATA